MPGTLTHQPKGSAAGHNGITDVIEKLGTSEFPRVRLGVHPGHPIESGADYLLSRFTRRQTETLERAVLGAQAGVSEDVPAGERRLGSPAVPMLQAKRLFASQKHLPEMSRRLRAAERRLEQLETRLGIAPTVTGEPGTADERA